MREPTQHIKERIAPEQRVDGFTACWIWQRGRDRRGYGFVSFQNRQLRAHRYVYEALVGPIPEGLVIDHLCRVTSCVNPEHLEPVTNAENVMRGYSPQAVYARQTHCINGHEYTPESVYEKGRGRACKLCRKLRAAQRTAARRAHRAANPIVSTWGQNMTHGKSSTYRAYHCRCAPCTAANTESSRIVRERTRRRKQQGAA